MDMTPQEMCRDIQSIGRLAVWIMLWGLIGSEYDVESGMASLSPSTNDIPVFGVHLHWGFRLAGGFLGTS
jgi:hypothetical protein